MRDFDNFRHRVRCAISFVRKTEPLGGSDFAYFGKHGRCEISLILDSAAGARFRLAGNGAISPNRFHLHAKRGRCAISLILEIVAGARFRLSGKRNRWPWGDFVYSGNMIGARFREFWKSRPARDCAWPGNGTIGRETISLIWETRSVRYFANFGNRGRLASSHYRETEPVGVGRFRLF